MTATDATFQVFCPGILEVLSIGRGDLKLAVGDSPKDREHARELIGEMLRKGYSIFVETDDGPVRVMGFIGERMTYIIDRDADDPADDPADPPPADEDAGQEAPRKPRGRPRRAEVPVEGSTATAVGRTAGG